MLLITGASGRIARRVAELLACAGHSLRLMTRTPELAPKLPASETVRGDFAEPSTLTDAFTGTSAALIVSASGEPGERARLHRNAFEAAARARLAHVVYLSLQGAAPDSKFPFSRDHYLSEQCLFATGIPCTVLRNAFYMDMFLEKFDTQGVIRGPARQERGAFVSREDVARTAASVLLSQPGGTYDVTGPEAMSVAVIAERLSTLVGRNLRYEDELATVTRERLRKSGSLDWRVELSVGWFEAIAAGELKRTSDSILRFTGTAPLTLEEYFCTFPNLLGALMSVTYVANPSQFRLNSPI